MGALSRRRGVKRVIILSHSSSATSASWPRLLIIIAILCVARYLTFLSAAKLRCNRCSIPFENSVSSSDKEQSDMKSQKNLTTRSTAVSFFAMSRYWSTKPQRMVWKTSSLSSFSISFRRACSFFTLDLCTAECLWASPKISDTFSIVQFSLSKINSEYRPLFI